VPRKLQVSSPTDDAALQGSHLTMQEPRLTDAASPVEIQAVAPGVNVIRPAQVTAPAPILELPDAETFAEKYLHESGLARLRPPLTPAASGDNFISIIPYQVRVPCINKQLGHCSPHNSRDVGAEPLLLVSSLCMCGYAGCSWGSLSPLLAKYPQQLTQLSAVAASSATAAA
jgi:hypothetical protein